MSYPDPTFRRQRYALDRAIQKEFSTMEYLLTVGLIKFCWNYSRTALFVYVIPLWCYVFSAVAISLGLSDTSSRAIAFSIVLLCLGAVCLLLMVGSMLYGLQKTFGVCRIVAWGQIGLATLFALVVIYRMIELRDFFEAVANPVCLIAMLLMVIFFVITVIADLIHAFTNRQAME